MTLLNIFYDQKIPKRETIFLYPLRVMKSTLGNLRYLLGAEMDMGKGKGKNILLKEGKGRGGDH